MIPYRLSSLITYIEPVLYLVGPFQDHLSIREKNLIMLIWVSNCCYTKYVLSWPFGVKIKWLT